MLKSAEKCGAIAGRPPEMVIDPSASSLREGIFADDFTNCRAAKCTVVLSSVSMGGVLSDVWHPWLGVSGLITRHAADLVSDFVHCPDFVLNSEKGGLA